jgi:hypothetical protein
MRQPDNQHDHDRPGSGTTHLFEPVWARDFTDLSYEWRRLFSELFGTFLLVLAAAGAAVVQDRTHSQIGRLAEVTAPGLTVLTVILFMGTVRGPRWACPNRYHAIPALCAATAVPPAILFSPWAVHNILLIAAAGRCGDANKGATRQTW